MNSKRGTKGSKARAGGQEYKGNRSETKAQERQANEGNNEARPHSAKEYEKKEPSHKAVDGGNKSELNNDDLASENQQIFRKLKLILLKLDAGTKFLKL